MSLSYGERNRYNVICISRLLLLTQHDRSFLEARRVTGRLSGKRVDLLRLELSLNYMGSETIGQQPRRETTENCNCYRMYAKVNHSA